MCSEYVLTSAPSAVEGLTYSSTSHTNTCSVFVGGSCNKDVRGNCISYLRDIPFNILLHAFTASSEKSVFPVFCLFSLCTQEKEEEAKHSVLFGLLKSDLINK